MTLGKTKLNVGRCLGLYLHLFWSSVISKTVYGITSVYATPSSDYLLKWNLGNSDYRSFL